MQAWLRLRRRQGRTTGIDSHMQILARLLTRKPSRTTQNWLRPCIAPPAKSQQTRPTPAQTKAALRPKHESLKKKIAPFHSNPSNFRGRVSNGNLLQIKKSDTL